MNHATHSRISLQHSKISGFQQKLLYVLLRTLSDLRLAVEREPYQSNVSGSFRDFLTPFLIGTQARSVKVLVPIYGAMGSSRPTLLPVVDKLLGIHQPLSKINAVFTATPPQPK